MTEGEHTLCFSTFPSFFFAELYCAARRQAVSDALPPLCRQKEKKCRFPVPCPADRYLFCADPRDKTNLKICFPAGGALRFHGFRASYNPRNPEELDTLGGVCRPYTILNWGAPSHDTGHGTRNRKKKGRDERFLQQNPLLVVVHVSARRNQSRGLHRQ